MTEGAQENRLFLFPSSFDLNGFRRKKLTSASICVSLWRKCSLIMCSYLLFARSLCIYVCTQWHSFNVCSVCFSYGGYTIQSYFSDFDKSNGIELFKIQGKEIVRQGSMNYGQTVTDNVAYR